MALSRIIFYLGMVGVVASLASYALPEAGSAHSHSAGEVIAGKEVYIAEGCIHCHSQYVRPVGHDVEYWGPVSTLDSTKAHPVLIGNRRQGPDLSNCGTRRSRDWNKAHLISPQEVSPGSSMPSYRHLFEDERGETLLDYLDSLGADHLPERYASTKQWSLPGSTGNTIKGAEAYALYCQQCHGQSGLGDGPVAASLQRAPANLRDQTWLWVDGHPLHSDEWKQKVAGIIKFGLPGTSMPGHEYLSDEQIADLVCWIDSYNPLMQ